MPPDRGLHTRHQLARAERLGHIVIRSEFQKQYFIDDFGYRAEHDYRRIVRYRFHTLAKLAAGYLGQNQIQDDGQRPLCAKQGESSLTVSRRDDVVLLTSKQALEHLLHSRVIFYNQDCA